MVHNSTPTMVAPMPPNGPALLSTSGSGPEVPRLLTQRARHRTPAAGAAPPQSLRAVAISTHIFKTRTLFSILLSAVLGPVPHGAPRAALARQAAVKILYRTTQVLSPRPTGPSTLYKSSKIAVPRLASLLTAPTDLRLRSLLLHPSRHLMLLRLPRYLRRWLRMSQLQ